MGRGIRKVKENFICENCNYAVSGNGFTNHCPQCLCSKHVDNTPGDRAMLYECGCLMEPIGVTGSRGGIAIIHQCINCGVESINRTSPDDNDEMLQTLPYTHKRKKRTKSQKTKWKRY